MHGSRFLVVLTAVMLLLSSGCDRTETKDPSSAGPGGRNTPTNSQAASTNGGPIDVLLVPADYFSAFIIHPRRIAQSPLLAELMKDEEVVTAIRKVGIHPDEIEQIVVPIRAVDVQQPDQPKLSGYMIARFAHEVDAKEILAKLHPRELIQEVQFGGRTCLDLGPGAGLAYAAGKDTIVLASKENMGKILAVATSPSPLSERLKKASADNDVIVTGELESHPGLDRRLEACKADVAPLLRDYLEIATSLREFAVVLDLRGDALLQIVLDAKDAQAASAAEERFKDAKRMLAGLLAVSKQSTPKQVRSEYADAFKWSAEAIDSIRVGKSSAQVTLTMKRPAGFDNIGPLVAKAVRAYFTVSTTRPRPQPQEDKPMPARPDKSE